ncbi:hypothetical protein SARC_05207 [Sphaeroforma arctica JP610]|uniref:Uncharacterized protein n=1 Tax=Sphaeroforma arctica JP610 TaxID=667725 RepID=A0A0L0G063_9EUKA|nr:hypothetical protein SARC_05207 [Sphaeroforma arctica JP610]KNC82507.1 hypothetical protein SARC_05207 [Sphaeroforma arctica JP610]|eukprot:XP_014156409.1 hypothetical protein SARC_05207 [Sphaeroforma arctica JP610]
MKFQATVVAAIAAFAYGRQVPAGAGDAAITAIKEAAVTNGCYEEGANTLECLEAILIDGTNAKFTEFKPLLKISPAASYVATIETLLASVTADVEACYGEEDCAATAACNAGYNTEGLAADFQADFVEPIAACCGTDDVQTCTESAIDAGIVAASGNVAEAAADAGARK